MPDIAWVNDPGEKYREEIAHLTAALAAAEARVEALKRDALEAVQIDPDVFGRGAVEFQEVVLGRLRAALAADPPAGTSGAQEGPASAGASSGVDEPSCARRRPGEGDRGKC